MKKTLFLAISMMVVSFAFGQQETFHELPNQDHTVFERGIGDTVYVLEEHVTYNLQTDQFGCTKKDSVVCKVLAGTLIVPPNYFQILKDSIKNKSQICDCIKNEINYLNL